jgi:D-aminoacyl-tRNA deacylase
MRAVVQRVTEAKVTVEGGIVGSIGPGLAVLLGVGHNDTEESAGYLAEKIVNLRIFEDDSGKLNLSLAELGYSMLVVSQFTLWGDCRKGRRPSFSRAANPETAEKLYNYFVRKVKDMGIATATGRFQAMMQVHLVNDGPVTLMLDTDKTF